MVAVRQVDRRIDLHGRDPCFSRREGYADASRAQQLGSGLVPDSKTIYGLAYNSDPTALKGARRRHRLRFERWPSTTSGFSPCH